MSELDYTNNKYKNTLPYPDKEDYTFYFIYNHGECICTIGYGYVLPEKFTRICSSHGIDSNNTSLVKRISLLKSRGVIIEKCIHADYTSASSAYIKHNNTIYEQWKTDLFQVHGLDLNSEVDQLIFTEAWDRGHSSGYQEVDNCIYDIEEFANKVIKFHELAKTKQK